MAAAELLNTDYWAAGVIFILLFYALYQQAVLKQAAFVAGTFLLYGVSIQSYAGFAAFPMLLYNGQKGPSMKYFFYLFYPLHLLGIYFICKIMY